MDHLNKAIYGNKSSVGKLRRECWLHVAAANRYRRPDFQHRRAGRKASNNDPSILAGGTLCHSSHENGSNLCSGMRFRGVNVVDWR
jgi:hypothetical protein